MFQGAADSFKQAKAIIEKILHHSSHPSSHILPDLQALAKVLYPLSSILYPLSSIRDPLSALLHPFSTLLCPFLCLLRYQLVSLLSIQSTPLGLRYKHGSVATVSISTIEEPTHKETPTPLYRP